MHDETHVTCTFPFIYTMRRCTPGKLRERMLNFGGPAPPEPMSPRCKESPLVEALRAQLAAEKKLRLELQALLDSQGYQKTSEAIPCNCSAEIKVCSIYKFYSFIDTSGYYFKFRKRKRSTFKKDCTVRRETIIRE